MRFWDSKRVETRKSQFGYCGRQMILFAIILQNSRRELDNPNPETLREFCVNEFRKVGHCYALMATGDLVSC